jgi:hypothetical protein
VYSFDGKPPVHIECKFFGIDDAGQYLTKHIKYITKVDDTTYATTTNVYRIIPCIRGGDTNV